MPVQDTSGNALKQRLSRGESILGMWSVVPAAQVCELLIVAGLDFVILDAEHGGYDFATLEQGIRACQAAGGQAWVRSPGADAFFIQRALDLGADGILVPQIPGAQAAASAVRMCRFPPEGTRGFNPFTRGGNYGVAPQPRLARDYPLTALLVETPQAVAELDAILAEPLLDLVYLGVYDYSVALGVPGQVDDPRIESFVADTTRRARAAGKAVCAFVRSASEARRFAALGVNAFVYGTETWALQRHIGQVVEAFRAELAKPPT